MPLPYQQGLTDSIPYWIVALCCYGGLASGQVGREADYTARVNVMEKVLDFIQLGGA